LLPYTPCQTCASGLPSGLVRFTTQENSLKYNRDPDEYDEFDEDYDSPYDEDDEDNCDPAEEYVPTYDENKKRKR